ncbi:H-2 class I histocompatibility antigen, Q7 alpha chain [Oryzias melastigma]|uniref:H-2 class I histocompatibility antigen, Q7 alpha chain n=1 Tax=Oryzias melastigma TaxID=30732 RepID=UPI000CF7ED5F|nr:H-2 class I histocompatibility antigen, Q7 alpha chain [Oryzias melastigma]
MFFIMIHYVLVAINTASSEIHSLMHTCTVFSKPVNLTGIHEFTAIGLLDDRMIYYYDSTIQKKIPKQKWMKEILEQEYWDKGTEFEKGEEKRFETLISQRRSSLKGIHVLQWLYGCFAEEDKNGTLQFKRSLDMFNFDGNVIQAGTPSPVTVPYNMKECMDMMKTFLVYSTSELINASITKPPDVFMFATRAKEKTNIVLTCLATGFYPKNITMEIKRNGRVLTADDGLLSTGVRPNDDDTLQRRDHVEILRTDSANYTCRVTNKKFGIDAEKTWDRHLPLNDDAGGAIAVGVVVVGVVLLVLVFVLVVIVFKRNLCFSVGTSQENPSVSSTPTISSENSPLIKLPRAVSSPRGIPNQRTPNPSLRRSMSDPTKKTNNKKTFYSSI